MSSAPHVLLIDSHKVDHDYYLDRLLTSLKDFVILHAATGQSGLIICKTQPIDCVILELDLPDMSGFEVLLKLIPRPWHAEIPVIVLTGIANQYLLKAALTNGAQAAFYKPMASGDMLHQAVLKALATVPKDRKRSSLAAQ